MKFDLTNKLTPNLDRHMVLPLMEFLAVKKIYSRELVVKVKLDLLCKTNMLDLAMEIQEDLYPGQNVPEELVSKRALVMSDFNRLEAEAAPVIKIFQDKSVQSLTESSKDNKAITSYIVKKHNFDISMMDVIYRYAKFQFECGRYGTASDFLAVYTSVVSPTDKNYLSALWGKLAAEILTMNWSNAMVDLNKLKESIDSGLGSSTPLQALQQRTWLIHWSLFVFFNHPKGKELVIDMFLYQTQYLNTIQTTCPHVLRYLATAVVIHRTSKRAALRDLIKIIQQETYTYSDPITEFLASLYVDYDFNAAQEKLSLCAKVLESDFFLVACQQDFIENARLMIFELFCRIHQCISIDMLAQKLNMSPVDAERWIVDLIRQAKLDAKIDSKQGHVVMGTQAISPYQQLIDKTKNLSFRTQMLAANIEKKANDRSMDNNYGDMY